MNIIPSMDVVINNSLSLSSDKVIKQPSARRARPRNAPNYATSDQLPIDIELLLSQRLEKML